MFEEMLAKGLDVTIFFYNPNIHPRKDYEIRKEENKKYAIKNNVPFVDCDYDANSWLKKIFIKRFSKFWCQIHENHIEIHYFQ